MPTRSKWQRVVPGCYAQQLPVCHVYSMSWPQTVHVGTYDTEKGEFLIFDGKGLRRILPQPTHWRVLASPPYVAKHVRKPRLAWRAELYRTAKVKFDAVAADRARGLSWHRVAARHGYRTGSAARESHKAREKYLAREHAEFGVTT